MPKGILNHDIWERAKRKVNPDNRKNKWPLVNHVYQQMGGKFNKIQHKELDMSKAINDIQNLSKLTNEDLVKTIVRQSHGEDSTITKSVLARLGAKAARLGHKAITGAGKTIANIADRGIARNMARRGMVGTAKQTRMGNIADIGRRMAGVTPKQVRGGVRRGIKGLTSVNPGTMAMAGGAGLIGGGVGAMALRRRRAAQANKSLDATLNDIIKGADSPGKRDGTGPYKGSYQKKMVGKGKRKVAGEKCPAKSK